jgi:DNA-binding SARP family transcriptional activator
MPLRDSAPTDPGAGRDAVPGPIVAAKLRIPTTEALPRERLEARLDALWRHRLTLVIAPAGSGKTTLLARFAANATVPVAWYRAETWDADEPALLRYLEAALTRALPGVAGDWTSVDAAASALDGWTRGRALLVLDDLHALEDTPAEVALGRFVQYAPPWLAIVGGSRVAPAFNLPRLRVSGELQEIGPDDLRFRAWEAERLFRDFYRDPVPPSDLASLARRTEGWAAGLQLFHLATRGKSAEERRRILTGAGSSVRLLREYLARNVLAELPDELRRFLVETSVLGRLTGPLCDRLLARRGSAAILDELAHRQIFTVALDDDEGSYRYHEVLRSHLDRILVEELGEEAARTRHAEAASLLEAAGATAEALGAYCRAEDWTAVRRLLGGQGERLAVEASRWLAALPPAVVRHDPWLTLASARGARAAGQWASALDAYARAETAFGASGAARVPARERSALAAWLDPTAIPPADWTGMLRAGVVRDPVALARDAGRLDDAPTALVRGLLELAAGEVGDARRDLEAAASDSELTPVLAVVARLGSGTASVLHGDWEGTRQLHDATEQAERLGQGWLARVGRILAELDPEMPLGEPEPAEDEDPWGATIHALVRAWTGLMRASASADPRGDALEAVLADAEHAATTARRLGAAVIEAWARGLVAATLARLGQPEAREAALAAESLARTTGTPVARMLAYDALRHVDPARADEYAGLVETVVRETAVKAPGITADAAPTESAEVRESGAVAGAGTEVAGVRVRIRTFGGFGIDVDGRRVALDRVKPRARAVLRLLALHGGNPVHREIICEALWPDADAATGGRSLHVAISALRGALADAAGAEASRLLVRDGDAYRLAIPADAVDVARFDRAIAEGRAARARGEIAAPGFGLALEIHAGDLLPEDGPAEWVVDRRERYRTVAVEAARAVAEESLLADQLDDVVRACRRGLEIDRTYDPLWRLLIEARDRAGDAGAASRERREYEVMLAGLGIETPTAVGAS